jgi:hypothetical protein
MMKLYPKKYPTLARILSSQAPVDSTEKKKFATTLKNMINEHYKYSDLALKDLGGNWMKIEIGDWIADGPDNPAIENLKDKLARTFWEMKTKNTYKTIHPNWWEPYTPDGRASGDILIGLGQEDESNPDLPE